MSDCLSLASSFFDRSDLASDQVSFDDIWNHARSLRSDPGNSNLTDEDLLNKSQSELIDSYVGNQRELFDHYSMLHNGSKSSD